jgi:Mg2+/citrate symporter
MAKNPREKISQEIISGVDLLNEDVGEVDTDISEHEQRDMYDRQYADSNKKHRNLLSKLNHLFVVVSHPFSLVVIFLSVSLVFLVTRYIRIGINEQSGVVSKISEDAGSALSYLGTIIVTSVFTKFLERKKR